jgi:glutaredoxin
MFINRTTGCPMSTLARRVLDDYGVKYHELYYNFNEDAKARLMKHVGFLSVPTLYVAETGSEEPATEPLPVEADSPRGMDRGSMITEPSEPQLLAWLRKHGMLPEEADAAD